MCFKQDFERGKIPRKTLKVSYECANLKHSSICYLNEETHIENWDHHYFLKLLIPPCLKTSLDKHTLCFPPSVCFCVNLFPVKVFTILYPPPWPMTVICPHSHLYSFSLYFYSIFNHLLFLVIQKRGPAALHPLMTIVMIT